jgi:hypothetical protein
VWTEHIGPSERALDLLGRARRRSGTASAITHRLRGDDSGGIVFRGRHIHHYNFGIALLASVRAIAVRQAESPAPADRDRLRG